MAASPIARDPGLPQPARDPYPPSGTTPPPRCRPPPCITPALSDPAVQSQPGEGIRNGRRFRSEIAPIFCQDPPERGRCAPAETLKQCWVNVRPPSTTLSKIEPALFERLVLAASKYRILAYKYLVFATFAAIRKQQNQIRESYAIYSTSILRLF